MKKFSNAFRRQFSAQPEEETVIEPLKSQLTVKSDVESPLRRKLTVIGEDEFEEKRSNKSDHPTPAHVELNSTDDNMDFNSKLSANLAKLATLAKAQEPPQPPKKFKILAKATTIELDRASSHKTETASNASLNYHFKDR